MNTTKKNIIVFLLLNVFFIQKTYSQDNNDELKTLTTEKTEIIQKEETSFRIYGIPFSEKQSEVFGIIDFHFFNGNKEKGKLNFMVEGGLFFSKDYVFPYGKIGGEIFFKKYLYINAYAGSFLISFLLSNHRNNDRSFFIFPIPFLGTSVGSSVNLISNISLEIEANANYVPFGSLSASFSMIRLGISYNLY